MGTGLRPGEGCTALSTVSSASILSQAGVRPVCPRKDRS